MLIKFKIDWAKYNNWEIKQIIWAEKLRQSFSSKNRFSAQLIRPRCQNAHVRRHQARSTLPIPETGTSEYFLFAWKFKSKQSGRYRGQKRAKSAKKLKKLVVSELKFDEAHIKTVRDKVSNFLRARYRLKTITIRVRNVELEQFDAPRGHPGT